MQHTKKVIIASLFGALIALTKFFLPFPIDKMLIVVEALLLALSALILKKGGATYVGFVAGILVAFLRPALGLFSFIFAILYGVLIDGFFVILKVDSSKKVSIIKTVLSLTLSSSIIGSIGYYVTSTLLGLIPMQLTFAVIIIGMGTISGAVAGYAAAFLWNRHLKNVF